MSAFTCITCCAVLAASGAVAQDVAILHAVRDRHSLTDGNALRPDVVIGAGLPCPASKDAGGLHLAIALDGHDLAAAAELADMSVGDAPFVCANVVFVATGMPVARTHVVATLGDRRIAFVGLTQVARTVRLPETLRVQSPLDALRTLRPRLDGVADAVVVLAAMDRLDAAELLHGVDGIAAVIVPARGANDPTAVVIGGGVLVQSPDTDGVLGKLDIGRRANTFVAVPAPRPPAERNPPAAVGSKTASGFSLREMIADAPPPAGDVYEVPAYTAGATRPLLVHDANRAIDLRVHSFSIVAKHGGRAAAKGRAWLVADVEWTNEISVDYAFNNHVPVAFDVADFREILFAVVDGARLGRFDPELSARPGGMVEKEFLLRWPGSQRRGTAVFDVTASEVASLDLCFYDFKHGHIRVPLLQHDSVSARAAPLATASNEVLIAEVHAAMLSSVRADGQRLMFVDLRARSSWLIDVDATAFDPQAKPGAFMKVPSVGRWGHVRKLVTLRVDSAGSNLTPWKAADSLLLPDFTVGDGVWFEVPEAARQFELHLQFPTVSVPGRREPLQPRELRMPLTDLVRDRDLPLATDRFTELGAEGVAAGVQPVTRVAFDLKVPEHSETATDSQVARGLAGFGLTDATVAMAVGRGSDSLWATLKQKKAGNTAESLLHSHEPELLGALALLHSGVAQHNTECRAWVRQLLRSLRVGASMDVYQVGVACMIMERLRESEFLPMLETLAQYLVEAQCSDGSWDYKELIPFDAIAISGPSPLRVFGGRSLDGSPMIELVRRRPFSQKSGDNSTSQFALLGLHAAAANGIGVPAATWERANACIRRRQNADGGFGYIKGNREESTGGMTTAGLSMLLMTDRDTAQARGSAGVQRALAWLDRHLCIDESPKWDRILGIAPYYRYGIERCGRLLDNAFLGRHEWYPMGARFLVDTQAEDGTWGEEERVRDTAFALLFLTRATPPLEQPLKRGGAGMLQTDILTSAPGRVYLILDASGSMLEMHGGSTKFAAAIAAVQAFVDGLPPNTEFALRVYGHRRRAIEPDADTDSELILPFAPLDRGNVAAILQQLRARGRTPLAYSIAAAHDDLARVRDRRTLVVLLTDGGEDPGSRRDPRTEAARLRELDVSFAVLGFDIGRDDWNQQLRETAERGGGVYMAAAAGAELSASLLNAALGGPASFRVLDCNGVEVGCGTFGDSLRLPEGRHSLGTGFRGQPYQVDFWINTEATTRVVFDAKNVRTR